MNVGGEREREREGIGIEPPVAQTRAFQLHTKWYFQNSYIRQCLNVLLRVPSLFLFEALYFFNWEKVSHIIVFEDGEYFHKNFAKNYLEWNIHLFGYALALLLLLLPLQTLVEFYRLLVAGICLLVSHLLSWRFVSDEINLAVPFNANQHTSTSETLGAAGAAAANVGVKAQTTQGMIMLLFQSSTDIHLSPSIEKTTFQYLALQCLLAIVCSTMMDTKNVLRFCPYTLPFLARLCNFPAITLYGFHLVSSTLCAMQVFHILLHNISKPYHMAVSAYRWGLGAVRMYGYLPLLLSVFEWLSVPTIFLIFWLTMFVGRISPQLTFHNLRKISKERWIVVVLSAVAEGCGSPVSVLGLASTISYLAFLTYKATQRFVNGPPANGTTSSSYGWTEGMMLVLLCLQTEIIQVKPHQRVFIITIILFVILGTTLQSMYEIVEPVLLSLSAATSARPSKHLRVLALCLGLFVCPIFPTYHVVRYFQTDFWLLIIISSCLMTSVQVLGSILIYLLFLYDGVRSTPLQHLDDAVYYINALGKLMEYMIALGIVLYGTYESIYGEWSWIGSLVIVLHFYYGVYERGKQAWAAFLQRREAVSKISRLPNVSEEYLMEKGDNCAICLNPMYDSCCETTCKHCFHRSCLKKWLYVQLTCPLCQCEIEVPVTALSPLAPTPPVPSRQLDQRGPNPQPPPPSHIQALLQHQTSPPPSPVELMPRTTIPIVLIINFWVKDLVLLSNSIFSAVKVFAISS